MLSHLSLHHKNDGDNITKSSSAGKILTAKGVVMVKSFLGRNSDEKNFGPELGEYCSHDFHG